MDSVDDIFYLEMKIAIEDKCKQTFEQLKFAKAFRYVVFKIDKEQIIVDQTGDRNQTWDQFLHKLPKQDYRFAVFDLEFKTHDGINSAKIFFLNWQPEGVKIKTKMLYATGKQAFKTYLDLNTKQISVTSVDDMNEEALIKEFNK